MAIPRKGSRGIKVDGVSYRWRIRRKPSYEQECFSDTFSVGVEWADPRSRSVLVLESAYARLDSIMGMRPSSEPITPQIIASSIRAALSKGWQPGVKGSAFKHPLLAGPIDPEWRGFRSCSGT
ncbi:hypothetical protein DES53_104380 [Roseimicrobium gellanilyticum]|uniref:Uncharacterized protein n=1 Tax=Roseimicrobium gellanilyticum TaxID=748857 RepID=A0A366HN33_9BACT|nr:hypothetical protein [Roseimicrobium gellanilyticum]RBP44559.1 hypothetical protein DES53_104380 [Roseimicrobium gellanilyticum]